MHQLAPGKYHVESNISIKRLNAVDKSTYLDKTLTPTVVMDVEVNTRLAKASVAFSRLHKNVSDRRSIAMETKIKVYQAVMLTTVLYGCESWTVYQRHARKPKHFYITSLGRLLSLKWQDKILNAEVLTRVNFSSIHTITMQSQLRWAGHLVCMPDHRLPKKLLFDELHGKRPLGGQKKRHNSWEQIAI